MSMHRTFVSMITIISLLLLTACGGAKLTDAGTDLSEVNWTVSDFTYTDQDGKKVGLSDLKEKVWLASFIFTNCSTVCPVMTPNMVKLQKMLEEKGIPVEIVSFTVDPKRDKKETLKAYGQKFGVDFSNWHFLTDYSFADIKQLSEGSFKSPLAEPTGNTDQFMHGTSFYLIQSDKVIKSYNGVLETPYEAIVTDIEVLSNN